jgi:hypothetical protein
MYAVYNPADAVKNAPASLTLYIPSAANPDPTGTAEPVRDHDGTAVRG